MLTTRRRLARTIRSRAWSSPCGDPLGQHLLLVGGQQGRLVDLPEVGLQGTLDRVAAVSANTSHEDPRRVGQVVVAGYVPGQKDINPRNERDDETGSHPGRSRPSGPRPRDTRAANREAVRPARSRGDSKVARSPSLHLGTKGTLQVPPHSAGPGPGRPIFPRLAPNLTLGIGMGSLIT